MAFMAKLSCPGRCVTCEYPQAGHVGCEQSAACAVRCSAHRNMAVQCCAAECMSVCSWQCGCTPQPLSKDSTSAGQHQLDLEDAWLGLLACSAAATGHQVLSGAPTCMSMCQMSVTKVCRYFSKSSSLISMNRLMLAHTAGQHGNTRSRQAIAWAMHGSAKQQRHRDKHATARLETYCMRQPTIIATCISHTDASVTS